jgi:hypothetical protein
VNPVAADSNVHLSNGLHAPPPREDNQRTPPPSYASLAPPPGPYTTATYPYYTPIPTMGSGSQVFGPTPVPLNLPLSSNQGVVVSGTVLLPYAYYDAAAVDARARRRFVESMLCGVGVWVLVGVVLVLEVVGEVGRW